ncbi:Unknown protein, partial [Striga hermonthica]
KFYKSNGALQFRKRTTVQRAATKLEVRYYGPYQVLKRIGQVAYRLELPKSSHIHPVIHVSQLKRSLGEAQKWCEELQATAAGGWVIVRPSCAIEYRQVKKSGHYRWEVLVEWEELPSEEATWEDLDEIREQFSDFVLEDKETLEGDENDADVGRQFKNALSRAYHARRRLAQRAGETQAIDGGACDVRETSDPTPTDAIPSSSRVQLFPPASSHPAELTRPAQPQAHFRSSPSSSTTSRRAASPTKSPQLEPAIPVIFSGDLAASSRPAPFQLHDPDEQTSRPASSTTPVFPPASLRPSPAADELPHATATRDPNSGKLVPVSSSSAQSRRARPSHDHEPSAPFPATSSSDPQARPGSKPQQPLDPNHFGFFDPVNSPNPVQTTPSWTGPARPACCSVFLPFSSPIRSFPIS